MNSKEFRPGITLEQRVLLYVKQHNLLAGVDRLVVAVSGGPDSVCLLHVLAGLRKELNVSLHVAHLDHQLRGVESEADAQYVSILAERLGILATIEQRDVKAYQAAHRLSLEEAAREVRYTFFADVAASVGTDRVAVGHTTDDHVETILLHLIRGTGTRGLRGLQPCSLWQFVLPAAQGSGRRGEKRVGIVRPLLEVTRKETEDYCSERKLMPRMDSSNLSLSLLRNRVRRELVPLIKEYNPRATEALLRAARIAADDLAFIEEEVDRLWAEVACEDEGTVILDKERFRKLHPAAQRHILRRAIEKLLGNLKDIETRHIEEIVAALDKPAGRMVVLPAGLVFSIEYDRYLLGFDPAAPSPFPPLDGEFPLRIPGDTAIPGWRIEAAIVEHPAFTGKLEGAGVRNSYTTFFDFDKTGDRLAVRTRRPGDRFQPLGMAQPKKLGEFMIDAMIPHAWRDRIPIICSPEQILWVVGWRMDERVKVTPDTRKVLRLTVRREQGEQREGSR